jgi:hypothetical protein
MVDWFIEDQKVKNRGWRKYNLNSVLSSVDMTRSDKFLKIKPIKVKNDELWSIDFIWVNSTTIGSLVSSKDITTETINTTTQELKNQLIYPIILKLDIDRGKFLESKNTTLAKVAYECGIKRVPVVIFNIQQGKPVEPSVDTKTRYAYYWKFTPYTFSNPELIMNSIQKAEWKKHAYLINKRQLFSDPEWQELRTSFLKTWNKTPEENIKRLRHYLGDYKDSLRCLRAKYYLSGDGFIKGRITDNPEINKLIHELESIN